jgi:hypothetical protein
MRVPIRLALAAVLCLTGCVPLAPTSASPGETPTVQAGSYSSGSANPPYIVHCTIGGQSSWTTYAECKRRIAQAVKHEPPAAQPPHDASVCKAPPYGVSKAEYETFVKNFGSSVDTDQFLRDACEARHPS